MVVSGKIPVFSAFPAAPCGSGASQFVGKPDSSAGGLAGEGFVSAAHPVLGCVLSARAHVNVCASEQEHHLPPPGCRGGQVPSRAGRGLSPRGCHCPVAGEAEHRGACAEEVGKV